MKKYVILAKGLVTAAVVGVSANAVAMPTKEELSAAQPLVTELMAPAMDAFKGAAAKEKSWAGMKEWLGVPLVFDAK